MPGFPEWRYNPAFMEEHDTISELTTNRGRIMFQMAPGHDEAASNNEYVCIFLYDSNNYIKVYFSNNNEITLALKDSAASEQTDTWDCTGALLHDGTVYEVMIVYDKSYIKLYIDNSEVASITYDVNFGDNNIPYYYALGSDIANTASTVYTSTTFTVPAMGTYDERPTSDGLT